MRGLVFVLLIIGIWIGLVLGISFIEAPLKFHAPGITTELGLGIGRLVFGVSSKLQLGFMLGLLLFGTYNYKVLTRPLKWLGLLLLIVISYQNFYLLPLLDERAELIITKQVVAETSDHLVYIILEAVKLILLAFLFFRVYYRITK